MALTLTQTLTQLVSTAIVLNQQNASENLSDLVRVPKSIHIIIIIINSFTARVVGAPQMTLQPVFSIFPRSPLPSGTCRTPGLSIPWCCLPTSSSVCLVFFPLSLCLAIWFWPDLMNEKHDHTTANAAVVYTFLESISGLEPSSVIGEPMYLKLVTVSSFCPFTLISVLMPLVLSSAWSSRHWSPSVSYTHLTLPTNAEV